MKRLLLCTLLLLAPTGVHAQTAWLPALRDTLDRLRDAGARRKLLEEAARQHPSEAWPHVGIALAYAGALPSDDPLTLRGDPGEHGWKELLRAQAIDPASAPAALVMAMQALGGDDTARLATARQALMRAGAPAASARLAVALAEVGIRLGDYAAATAAVEQAVDDPEQGGAARRLLGIGLMRLPGSAEDGARAYLSGAARAGFAAAAYFRDAAALASAAERDAWRRAPDDAARAAWVSDFWSRRAAAAGVATADRLAEHFHRLALADRQYRVRWVSPAPATDIESQVAEDLAYGDQGLVYLRYGAPDRSEARGDLRTWVYWRPRGKTLRFFFQEDRFAESIPLRPGAAGTRPAIAGGATPYDAAIELLQELAPEDAELTQLGGRLVLARQALQVPRPVPCGRRSCSVSSSTESPDAAALAAAAGQLIAYESEARAILRKRMAEALAGEDALPTVDRALPFFFDLATFRGTDGSTDIVASLAIPGELLPSFAFPDGRVLYAPRVQLAFASAGAGSVRFADSAFQRVAPRRLRSGEYVRVALPLSAPPAPGAAYRLGVRAVADSVMGQVYAGSMQLPDYSGPGLKLSDIVLADGEGPGMWQRGSVRLAFVPAQRFPAHGPVKLFYEIYNLPPGRPYRTELAIERARGSMWERVQGLFADAPGRTLVWEDTARPDSAGTQQEVRLIHPDLKPGRYRIVVTVDSPSTGEQVSRTRRFDLSP